MQILAPGWDGREDESRRGLKAYFNTIETTQLHKKYSPAEQNRRKKDSLKGINNVITETINWQL